ATSGQSPDTDVPAPAAGGGLYSVADQLTVTDSTITQNTAAGPGNVPPQFPFTSFHGGGVYTNGAGAAPFTGGTLRANTANQGGGIYNDSRGALSLAGSAVNGNTAAPAGGSAGAGGGVYNAGGTITLSARTLADGSTVPSTVSGNIAEGFSDAEVGRNGVGG